MTAPILLFVNDRPVRVPPEGTLGDAVAASDGGLAAKLREGAAYLTDGRGIRVEPSSPVFPGAIIRVVLSARASRNEADAHP
jgi:hypothetical protein